MKRILSVDEQIDHMKKKGITFNVVSAADAKDFLSNHNYYMKLAAYRANYTKCDTGKRTGQYVKLDFGYLQELSTLDMHLRYLVMEMCLDIEHALKVRVVNEITNSSTSDGYDEVRKFLKEDQKLSVLKQIQSHKSGEYCHELIEKYYPYFPVWVFLEIISFGTLLHFCAFYEKDSGSVLVNNALMNTIRDLRNASAHSNCIMNKMGERLDPTKQPHSDITTFVRGMPGISDSSRRHNLSCKFAYNMTTLLFVYESLVPKNARKKRYDELKDFMDNRAIRHKDYFASNTKITSTYKFLKKEVDFLHDRAYNT